MKRRYGRWFNTDPGGDPAGGGGGDPAPAAGFQETIAPEYRDAIAKTGIGDVNGLAKAYLEAQSFLGGAVRIPGPDAPPDDMRKFEARLQEKVPALVRIPEAEDADGWKAFWSRLGTPDAPTGYTFAPVEDLPETIVKPTDDWLADVFHKAGVPKTMAEKVRAEIVAANRTAYTQHSEATTAAENDLRTRWGAGYEQRLALALGLPAKLLGPEKGEALRQRIETAGLGNVPELLEVLSQAALGLGEDPFVAGTRPTGLPNSLAEVDAQIAEIQRNPAYGNNRDPAHKPLVAKMENLHQQRMAILSSRAA